MEVKKSKDMVMENKDTMAYVTSVFENFPLSRIVLQQNSKNIHIVNAINQLLSKYHPDDGIAAYEHVLKTLLVLLENFDSNTQQQIISIVPSPKGVSNKAIRDIIYKTTGLIRAANNVTMCQKITVVPEEELNTKISNEKSKIHLTQNVLVDTAPQNLELDENFVPSISEVFRGFPPNEISMIHSHVRNVNYVYDTLDYNVPCIEPYINVRQNLVSNTDQQEVQSNSKFKWIHTPHLLYKNNTYQVSSPSCQQGFFKSIDDKYFQLPIDKVNNYNQWNIANMSHTLHQDNACFKKKLCQTKVISHKEDTTEVSNVELINSGASFSNCYDFLHNENQDLKKYDNNLYENKVFNMEKQKRFDQELKVEQQAIQQDIYKMDVVWNEEIDTMINSQVSKEDNFTMDNFVSHRKLKTSFQNFLKRSERDTFIEFPRLPQTKSLHTAPLSSKYWRFVTHKNVENKKQVDLSRINESNLKEKNTSENLKKLTEKKELESLNVYPKSSLLHVLHKSLNTAPIKTQTAECEKKDNIENLLYKSAAKQTEKSNANLLQQSASVTELATFKKHYYDTLLNIQKAKVAVANSLAISSVESSTKYDPYYSSCLYQQQQLLQQHGQLSVNPQFAVHTIAQSKLSNVHNAPYTWVRCNNWRYPTTRQLRFPQQSPFQHSRNKENSVLRYVKTVDVQCFAQDKNKQMKRCVQRKKLEEIVGKLKEIENSSINS